MPRDWDSYYSEPANVDWTPASLLVEAVEMLPPVDRSTSPAGRRRARIVARRP